VSACFFFHLSGSEEKQGDTGEGTKRSSKERWQGVSESAASAKRFCFMFGAKPAQSETPVRVRGQAGVHPEEGEVVERREATDGSVQDRSKSSQTKSELGREFM